MQGNRNPVTVNHTPVPGVKDFAMLAALESAARGILISVLPIAMYRVFNDAQLVSEIYFYVGAVSLVLALIIPFVSLYIRRRW